MPASIWLDSDLFERFRGVGEDVTDVFVDNQALEWSWVVADRALPDGRLFLELEVRGCVETLVVAAGRGADGRVHAEGGERAFEGEDHGCGFDVWVCGFGLHCFMTVDVRGKKRTVLICSERLDVAVMRSRGILRHSFYASLYMTC